MFTYQDKELTTRVAKDGGLNPKFNNNFNLAMTPKDIDESFEINIFDKATIGSDTLIGFVPIKVSSLLPNADN